MEGNASSLPICSREWCVLGGVERMGSDNAEPSMVLKGLADSSLLRVPRERQGCLFCALRFPFGFLHTFRGLAASGGWLEARSASPRPG